jgi:hypothetical protein
MSAQRFNLKTGLKTAFSARFACAALSVGTLLTLAAALSLPLSRVALAGPAGSPAQSLAELQTMEQAVENRHTLRMREIQDALSIQAYDSDTALMLRMKADQEYKASMETLHAQEQSAYRAMDAKQAHSGSGSAPAPAAPNPALPHFESQSVITYPQSDPEGPPAEEKPRREGQQKNVGLGTRELDF